MTELAITPEVFPIAGSFTISRGSRTESPVVTASLLDGNRRGWGECFPLPRYGESVDSVVETLNGVWDEILGGLDREGLQQRLPAGAARNALDCAFWDLEAKRAGVPVHALAGLPEPQPLVTAYTLSLADPATMREKAQANAHRPLLKLKLGGEGDIARLEAVRQGAPNARIIVDANESWTPDLYRELAPVLIRLGVAMVEQPLPAGKDEALAEMERPLPVCADESCHDCETLGPLKGRYDMINIKLDKTGGLTEALALKDEALSAGFKVMVGCMVGSSLAMAPAVLVGQGATFVDLDGPLLLARDREGGLVYDEKGVHPALPALWG
ncbi:N-acetyl-D-Glu racemase DgcA [Consotaella salsifontis]|uniref:Dipeptide epimerase n=1 Tax=Consotaella salsifontis TaxID=1365950 RepID=A0A1T4T723_9HYPH|nr:N-acetyl-D-Glu racemase DgcA [Consotaella salsifontis]SKA36276.1 L-alanine-DL-glutamate epimerase [Consotaella salsifontis]